MFIVAIRAKLLKIEQIEADQAIRPVSYNKF